MSTSRSRHVRPRITVRPHSRPKCPECGLRDKVRRVPSSYWGNKTTDEIVADLDRRWKERHA